MSLYELDSFFLNQPEPQRGCLMALRDLILNYNDQIEAAWKYRLPTFLYRGKMLCYLWKDKKTQEPYMGLMGSKDIEHPRLEIGNRKWVKIWRVPPNQDIDDEELYQFLSIVTQKIDASLAAS